MLLPPGPGVLLLAAAPAAQELRERAAAILREGAYQTALPGAPPPHVPLQLGWLEPLLRILLWAALAVAAVLAAAWLARRLSGAPATGAVPDAPAAAPVAIPIASAEALAAEGRFAEAIHALLLETLEALSRAARLAPSLTSREIVAGVPLPAPARDALAGLVVAVEVSRFGGAPARAEDYRTCLGRFHAFLESYRSGS